MRATPLTHRQLSTGQYRILIGIVTMLASQLYLDVGVNGFRVSAAAIFYPILLITMMRSSHRPDAGAVTALIVILGRATLDILSGMSLVPALQKEYTGGLFYLCYDCLLCLMVRDRRSVDKLYLMTILPICDLGANIVDLGLSGGFQVKDNEYILVTLVFLALGRGISAAALMWAMEHYHQLLLHQEHERRYQRLFVMTAELKNELYFLKKDSEDIEGVMSRAYQLYERLGELEISEEYQELALAIAREVHEIKKDNLRIICGIEGELEDVYDQEEMSLTDVFRILTDTTQRMLGEQRLEIRLECQCQGDVKLRAHYRVLSVLKNLVTNAIEAIQSDKGSGVVQARAAAKDGQLELVVSDNGPGISQRALNNLFQVGYSTKFDPETGNINRGVGLPAVQYIVDELGGSIEVNSKQGKGATFTVRLPLSEI